MFPSSYLSHVQGCRIARLKLAADDGGSGGGGTPADAPAKDDVTHDARPPDLLPCPFCGGSDLDTTGDVVTCNTDGVIGPVANADDDKYGAWNARAGADASAADDPATAPDADPAATVKAHKSWGETKTFAIKNGGNFLASHGRMKLALGAQSQLLADATASRKSAVSAITARVAAEKKVTALSAEVAGLKADKANEPKRLNDGIQRTLAASGHPAPVTGGVNTEGNTGGKPKADTSKLTGLAKAIAAHQASSTK